MEGGEKVILEIPPMQDAKKNAARLQEIIEAESTNFQWTKLFLNYSLIIILCLISFMRGATKPEDSLLNLKKCDGLDWGLFAILQVICLVYFFAGYRLVSNEIAEKEQVGYEFVEGDLRMTFSNVSIFVGLSFIGSLLAAFSGLGPGVVFGGGMIIIGIEPRVSTATGMYLTFLMTASSSIQLLGMRKLKLDYLVYILVFTIMGGIPGMFF